MLCCELKLFLHEKGFEKACVRNFKMKRVDESKSMETS